MKGETTVGKVLCCEPIKNDGHLFKGSILEVIRSYSRSLELLIFFLKPLLLLLVPLSVFLDIFL